jgi:hypothetical protein
MSSFTSTGGHARSEQIARDLDNRRRVIDQTLDDLQASLTPRQILRRSIASLRQRPLLLSACTFAVAAAIGYSLRRLRHRSRSV